VLRALRVKIKHVVVLVLTLSKSDEVKTLPKGPMGGAIEGREGRGKFTPGTDDVDFGF